MVLTFVYAFLKVNIKRLPDAEALPPIPQEVRVYGIEKDVAPIEEVAQIGERLR